MSVGIGQEQRIVVKEVLVMFCTGRVRRRGKGAVCWGLFGVFFCASRGTSQVWCGAHGKLSFVLGRKNARGLPGDDVSVSFQCVH